MLRRIIAIILSFIPSYGLFYLGRTYLGISSLVMAHLFVLLFVFFRVANEPKNILYWLGAFIAFMIVNMILCCFLQQKKSHVKSIILIITMLNIPILLAYQFYSKHVFGYELSKVSDESNKPALLPGDIVISDRWGDTTDLRKGDIVSFVDSGGKVRKRIHALSGDKVIDCVEHIFVNGKEYRYASDGTWDVSYFKNYKNKCMVVESFIIPEGYAYVLGEDQMGASDSKRFGPISLDRVISKSLYILSVRD